MKFKKRQLVLLIVIGLIISYFFFNKKSNQTSSDFSFLLPVVQTVLQPINIRSSDNLKNAVETPINDMQGSYAVYIKNLKNQEEYAFGQRDVFESASLYKLWVMATAYQNIQNKRLGKDEVMSQDIAVLNEKFDIATESAELTEGVITSSVENALEKMITVSDNYSALLLSEKIGLANVSKFLKDAGFNKSSLGEPPQTTAQDIALFFEKLYKGELANKEYTQEMINLLKKQALNTKIPKYLPENIIIAHKTGELGSVSHDAGVVFSPKADYIIVVLTDTDNTNQAVENISQISKRVYDYFQK